MPGCNVESSLTFKYWTDGPAAQRELDDVLDIAHLGAISCGVVPADAYPELWLVGFLLDRTIRSAADLLHESQYIRCKAAQFAQIRATELGTRRIADITGQS